MNQSVPAIIAAAEASAPAASPGRGPAHSRRPGPGARRCAAGGHGGVPPGRTRCEAQPLRVGLPGDGEVLLLLAGRRAEQGEGQRQRPGLQHRRRGGRLRSRRAQLEPPHHRQMARGGWCGVLGRCHVQHHQLQRQRTCAVVQLHAGLHLAAHGVGVRAQLGHRQHQEGRIADDVEHALLHRHQVGLRGGQGQQRAAQRQPGQRGTAPARRGAVHSWPFTQRFR